MRNPDFTYFRTGPDGAWVLYAADQAEDGVVEAFAVPVTGEEPVRRVNAPLVPGGDVSDPRFGPSGSPLRAYYLADQEQDNTRELFTTLLEAEPRADVVFAR